MKAGVRLVKDVYSGKKGFALHLRLRLTSSSGLTVSMPKNLFKTINETDPFTTKIQINHFNSDCFTAQDDYFNNT